MPELLSSEHWLTIESLLFQTFRGRSGQCDASTTCLLALMRIYAGGPVGIKFSSEEHILNGVVRAHTTITVTKPTLWSDEDCLVVQQALLACIGEASSSR